MGNGWIVAAHLCRTVPQRQIVDETPKAKFLFCVFFGLFLRGLQVVVHRVFLHLAVKLGSVQLLIEKRELRIIDGHTLIVKMQDFILVCADIHLVTEVIGILGSFLYDGYFFGRCGTEDFPVSALLDKLRTALFLLFHPFELLCHLFGIQVSVELYQLSNPLFHLWPFQVDVVILASDSFGKPDALAIVLLIDTDTYNNGINATDSVLIFQKVCVLFGRKALLELLINTHFSFGHDTATGENSVDDFLRIRIVASSLSSSTTSHLSVSKPAISLALFRLCPDTSSYLPSSF